MNEDNNNNEQDKADELATAVQQAMPGEILRKARESAGMSTQQVADRLRLRLKLIEDIEANNYGDNMEGTFIRGYLKAYAKLVQVPESDVIHAYMSMGVDEKPIEQMQSFSRRTSLEKDDNKLMILTWIIVLIIIGSVAFFVWQKFQEDGATNGANTSSVAMEDTISEPLPHEIAAQQEDQVPVSRDAESEQLDDDLPGAADIREAVSGEVIPQVSLSEGESESQLETRQETDPPATNDDDADTESATNENTAENAAQNTSQETTVSEVESVTDPEPTAVEAESANSDVDLNAGELVFVFNNDVWIRVQDATGEAIAYGVKNAGYVMPLNGVAPYLVTLGAPQHVDVYFQGEPVDLSHIRSGRVANIQIPE